MFAPRCPLWLKQLSRRLRGRPRRPAPARGRARTTRVPAVEALEDRTVPSASIPLSPTAWTAVGPAPITNSGVPGGGPVSGRVAALAPDPTDPNTVYLGAADGGVWVTGDAQDPSPVWTPLTDNLFDTNQTPLPQFLGALAVAHGAGGNTVLYAGLGEANNTTDSFYGRGILVSANGGTSWTLQNDGGVFDRTTVSKIVVDPTNPATVYAALANFGVNGQGTGVTGIWKSTDSGQTWTNTTANAGLTTTEPWSDVAVDPVNPATLYAAVGDIFGAGSNGVYVTHDGGNSWAPAGNFLAATGAGTSGFSLGRITLAVAPGPAHLTVYASASNPSNQATEGIYKSTDGGATWSVLTSDGTHTPLTANYLNYMGFAGYYNQTLIVDPNQPNVVYAGGEGGGTTTPGVIRSGDGGKTWTDIDTGANGLNGPGLSHHAMAFDAAGRLLDGNDSGVWRLDNPAPGSVLWTDLNGNLQTAQFVGIALNPANANIAFGGTQSNGTDEFNDALGWTQVRQNDGGFTRIDPTTPTTVYHEFQRGLSPLLERSDSGGTAPWTPITPPGASGGNFYDPYVLDPSNSQRLLFGTATLYESTDRGNDWKAIGTPGTAGFNPFFSGIDAIAVSGDGSTVYVTAGGQNFVTANDGLTWRQINEPNFGDGFSGLAVDPADPQTAYLVRNHFTGGSGGHVFRTTDGGQTWRDISGNLPDLPAWSIALDPRGTPTTRALYVGTDAGVYESTDGGNTWSLFQSGLPHAQARDLEIAPGLGILAAGTYGRGVYEIQLGVLAQVEGGVLTVQADANGDTIVLQIDPANASLLDVLQEGPTGESLVGSFPLTQFTSVSASGGAGFDGLDVDEANGFITTPISWDGGGGAGGSFDYVEVSDSGFFPTTLNAVNVADTGPGAGTLTLTPAAGPAGTVTFTNVATAYDFLAAAGVAVQLPAGAQGGLQYAFDPTFGYSGVFNQAGAAAPGAFADSIFLDPTASLTVQTAGGGSQVQLGAEDNTFQPPTETLDGAPGDVFQFQNAAAVSGFTSLTLTDATLDLNGLTPAVNGLNGNGTITNSAATSATLTVGTNNGSGAFAGAVQDGAGKVGLTKTGTGTQALGGTNTNSGPVKVSGGTLQLTSGRALPAAGTTTVAAGAALDLNGQGVIAGTIDLAGTGLGGAGALVNNTAAVASLAAAVVSTPGTYSVGGTGAITLTGSVQGTLTKVGANTLTFAGTADDPGLGVTVAAGTVVLAKNPSSTVPAVHAVGSGLTVSTGAVAQLGGTGGDQIADGAAVTLNGGTLDLNGVSEAVRGLTGATGTVLNNATGTTATLTVSGSGTSTFAGALIDHSRGTGLLQLARAGTGTLVLTGASTYTGGTTVSGGTLQVDGSLASAVTVTGSGTLDGTGTTGPVTAGGTLAPGDGGAPGVLNTGALSLTTGASFNAALGGTTPGTGSGHYAQVNVTSGTVTIGSGVTLNVTSVGGFVPTGGSGFVLIHNPGGQPVRGTFTGLPQGAQVSPSFLGSGLPAYITYLGGSGADVAIVFSVPPLPDLTPATPAGWGAPVVVANQPNTFTQPAVLTTTDTLYVNAGFLNQGSAPTTATYKDQVLLDGQTVATVVINPPQNPGVNTPVTNVSLPQLAAGSHTVTVNADYQNALPETDETNNTSMFVFTVNQAPAVTSPGAVTFTVGTNGTFTVTATGLPLPSLQETGGLPAGVSFKDNGNGTATLSGTPAAGSGRAYPLTITAHNVAGDATQTFNFTVDEVPSITSAGSDTFTVGAGHTFTVTTGGFPAPTLTETPPLPSGLTFTDKGNGTATISGTPAAGTGKTYPLTITAHNGIGGDATQTFNLTVDEAPSVTSPGSATFTVGVAESFTVTTGGFPLPALTESVTLPTGLTFTDNHDGTATLSGTPAVGTGKAYTLIFRAHNGIGTDATQVFGLTINESASITSAGSDTFTVGAAASFTVTTGGFPAAALAETGALPAGLAFADNHDGTATISGTPAAGTGKVYPLTLRAHNGIGTDATQAFTLAVDEAPSITSGGSHTFTVGGADTFTVTTGGFPLPALAETGTLPGGLTFTDNHNGTATISGIPAAGTGRTYSLAINAHNGVGTDATQAFALTVNEPASVTSAGSATFTVGGSATFTVTTGGFPRPTLAETGALPAGLAFADNHDGTATLSGTPAAGTGGPHSFTLTAHNGIGGDATQTFNLTVDEAPSIVVPGSCTLIAGTAGSCTVTTGGYPHPALTETGTLPSGLAFKDNGDGTATLQGTPAAGTGGTYSVTVGAQNGIGANATQPLNFTVNEAARITSPGSCTLMVGTAGSCTVTTAGFPHPALNELVTLPAGVTLTDNGDGTATLGGTPAAGAGGAYSFAVTAHNGIGGDATQTFNLTVNERPAFTSDPGTTFTVGTAGSFPLTVYGFPVPTLSESGDDLAPTGVGFNPATGLLSGTPAVRNGGLYTLHFIATNSLGSDSQTFNLTVNEAPLFTSPGSDTFTTGVQGQFPVSIFGWPTPTVSVGGDALPSALTFSDNHDGSATLAGTAAPGTGKTYNLVFTAHNGIGSDATQAFTLTVHQPAAFITDNGTTFTAGLTRSFPVSATGFPAPTLTLGPRDVLPAGVTFNPQNSQTTTATSGLLSGTPAPNSGGTYPLHFTAHNGVGTDSVQAFTLTVDQPPAITSAAAAAFTATVPGSFTVLTTGFPAPTLSESGALPAGVSFSPATGTLVGTPALGTSGTYVVTFTAANGVGNPAGQTFVLTVGPPPDITGPLNITGLVTVSLGPLTPVGKRSKNGGTFQQTVTVINNGLAAIDGPITLVLDSLSPRKKVHKKLVPQVTLSTGGGLTQRVSAGSPFQVGPSVLPAGGATTFRLSFRLKGKGTISFNPIVLAGFSQP